VITVVGTHNLALGVGVGVLLSGIFFAWKVAQIFRVTSALSGDGRERDYLVEGQLFFASVEDFQNAFDFKEPLDRVRIDVSKAHIWDISGVNAVDVAVLKFRREGIEVELVGMNDASATIMDKLAAHDRPGAMERMLGH
jgi:SulP family sulfate permease